MIEIGMKKETVNIMLNTHIKNNYFILKLIGRLQNE